MVSFGGLALPFYVVVVVVVSVMLTQSGTKGALDREPKQRVLKNLQPTQRCIR
jgi:hypothetical protein